MTQSAIRGTLRRLIAEILRDHPVGCFLRGQHLEEGKDIDLWIHPEQVPGFLEELEARLFGRHEFSSFYDFSRKELVVVDLVDEAEGERDHLDIWYCSKFVTPAGIYHITPGLLGHVRAEDPGVLETRIEGTLYALHLLNRKKGAGEREQRKLKAYREAVADGSLTAIWEETIAGDPTRSVALLVEEGILQEGCDRKLRRLWHRPTRPGRGVFAVMGADGVGKTTTINAMSERFKERQVKVRTEWVKFRRVYHRSWLYRRVRNFLKRSNLPEERREELHNRAALYAARLQVPLLKLFMRRRTLWFVDRYFIDLGILRKNSPIEYYDELVDRSYGCPAPNGILMLRAAPETIFERKGEMPTANVEVYYGKIRHWIFRSGASVIASISTESVDVQASSGSLADFVNRTILETR